MTQEIQVVRGLDPFGWDLSRVPTFAEVQVYDPHGRDGEWHAVAKLPHEIVEYEGYGVPAFEGDVERREWEARRR